LFRLGLKVVPGSFTVEMVSCSGDGPTFLVPDVGNVIGWFKKGFVGSMSATKATDPVIFFFYTSGSDEGARFPQEPFEIKCSSGELTSL